MKMMVEYAESPLAIGTEKPRFSWEVPFEGRRCRQSAYHLLVASSEELLNSCRADLWDSGRVESSQSVNVEYKGVELCSNADYFWTVKLWDESGNTTTGFCPTVYFGTALFKESDWQAQWIGMGSPTEPFSDPDAFQQERVTPEVKAVEPDLRAPLMRKEFRLDKPVKRARAFVSGLGLYELHLNGKKVGDDVLSTSRTDFRKRVLYSSYDITSQLTPENNALGLILGNGWFNGQKRYWGWQMQWYGSPKAIIQIEIEFTDGSHKQIVTDDSWHASWSPITFNCIYDGEDYDARMEQPGWDSPEFDSSTWQMVNLVASPGGSLVPMTHEQEQVVETIKPVSMKEPEPGVFVYDLGKNITGWVRLEVQGGESGDIISMRFGEAQYDNGALNVTSNLDARQQDCYTLNGSGKETYEPRFTFHGFQFVEVKGYPGTPDLNSITGQFVRIAVAMNGSFECGNELINNIHRCTLQSQLCNVQMGVPTDDTQRPERLGWGADAWATAVESLYNLWMPRVYQKWIGDFRDQQDEYGLVGMITPQAGAEEDLVWSSAFLLIPWWQYMHCGDHRILEENYGAMKSYISYLQKVGLKEIETLPTNEILSRIFWQCSPEKRFSTKGELGYLQLSQWGDHLATAEGSASRANMPLSIATAFYYLDVTLMAKIAAVLGKIDEALIYDNLASEIKRAFNKRFFDPAQGYYDTGVQSAQAWPLAFGLVPEEHLQGVSDYFVNSISNVQRHLTTGYAGTKYAIQALSERGFDDIVWKLAISTGYPSWGYMLQNKRTTSCERWDGDTGSLNHAPLGAAIDEWFYSGLAGICPDPKVPGFEKIIFKPYLPKELSWVKATLETVRGKVMSHWQHDGTTASLNITVPANSIANVFIPVTSPDTVTEGSKPAAESAGVVLIGETENKTVFEIGSGSYCFRWSLMK
jgi:alpha-L-rhamnosidase